MKRIFSILAVVCLIVSLAVPTLAAETLEVHGVWTLNDVITISDEYIGQEVEFTSKTSSGETINGTKISVYYGTYRYLTYHTAVSSVAYNIYNYSDDRWINPKGQTIDFGEVPQEVSADFYYWLRENATPPDCDGTTCPATDVNRDNVCDDCGMTFSLLRDYTPSDFPSGYPAVPSLDMPNARYFLYQVRSSEYIYLVVYPDTVTPTFDSTVQNGQLQFPESYGNFRLDRENNEWDLSSETSPYYIGGYTGNVTALYSSVQIYDEENEPFFPIPLWKEMEKVTQGEMTTGAQAVHGAMMTLAVCGIGCLALLVVLSLFGKRSLISLK